MRFRTHFFPLTIGEEQEYSLSERLADRRPNPEDEFRNSETNARLRELMVQLSPSLRKAFQLRDLDGLTTSEAAHILGVADGTVKAQLARARAKLRQLMRRALNPERRAALNCVAQCREQVTSTE
jgi:RNA polymerase sigma factor (sigma-70 family)